MIGIIGGTGLNKLKGLEISRTQWMDTPFGDPSSAISFGSINGVEIAFMARHGAPHQIPPHLINYRANLSALAQAGVDKIIAVNAVGGIHQSLGPAEIAIPDQIIDYTYGRDHTIFDGRNNVLDHVDFTHPYSNELRELLISSAEREKISVLESGVYGATQGPRLESSAEIKRLKNDGCDMVGMTGMPEAALARELAIDYACLALSVNWAAGLSDSVITMSDIEKAIEKGMNSVHAILRQAITQADQ